MGHYDEEYEFDRKQAEKKDKAETKAELNEEFKKFIKKASITDMKFMLRVIDKWSELQSFFKAINIFTKTK